jgi:hydroxymethylpyrimidine pyrophosphatase-like HAD family hydrolase/energy-coupling factor transporter ATP-binding protein EcfA2
LRYFCLICDYDGTIAKDSRVAPSTVEALRKTAASGRKLILATGRELDELLAAFPEARIFDRIIAENGALLYRPASKEEKFLGDPPPPDFIKELARRGVKPLSVGGCIVATWQPHQATVLEVIRDLGLELQIVFNKGAVMVLPSSINKGTGVQAALEELKLSLHNAVGVGDAENDHAFLGLCECSVAVANALPALKERADFVTQASHGAGVEDLIERLLTRDLQELNSRLGRHRTLLGTQTSGEAVSLEPYRSALLVAGPSGCGKSTFVAALVERLIESQYQVCLIDPEGDYDEFEVLVTLGGPDRIPGISEVLEVLNAPRQSLSINLLGVKAADRPAFFQAMLARLQELRSKTGRPHWIILDEAHHLLPAALDSATMTIPQDLGSFVLVTVHPDHVSPAILRSVNGIVAVGPEPRGVIKQFNSITGTSWDTRSLQLDSVRIGEVMVMFSDSREPLRVNVKPAKSELRRHRRKYAVGELGEDKSFYFRGPENKLNLRAQNMNIFTQLAEGIDEETWSYHLATSDYSRWLRESVKDQPLAEEVAKIEEDERLPAAESRARIIEAIRKHYTQPA